MDSFYRQNILDHYKNPCNFGRLKDKHASYSLDNPFCGDRIGMEIKLKIENGKLKIVDDIKFYGEGCAISVASASILTEKVKGMDIDKVKKLTADDIFDLLGIKLTPTRLKCALLPLEALHKTLSLVKES